jgi:hypothetical protein
MVVGLVVGPFSSSQELYLRNPALFNVEPGHPVSFAELAEAVRLTHQVRR